MLKHLMKYIANTLALRGLFCVYSFIHVFRFNAQFLLSDYLTVVLSKMATYQMYRETTVGESLQAVLDEMLRDELIPKTLAVKVMAEFDKAINRALANKVKNKMFFKAEKLRAYRFCDNVWTFLMERVDFREQVNGPVQRVKFVACDGQATKLLPGGSGN